MQPLISILLPNYNYAWCIQKAVDSILRQTYENWELIIVDDGSSDSSLELLQAIQSAHPDRIRVLTHPHHENRGLAASYQLALQQAKGEYIAFIESDDIWHKQSLAQRITVFLEQDSSLALVYSRVRIFGHFRLLHPLRCMHRFAGALYYLHRTRRAVPTNRVFAATSALHSINIVPTFSCAMVRRSTTENLNFRPPANASAWLDWWLWTQVSCRGSFYQCKRPLTWWRKHLDSYEAKANKNTKNQTQFLQELQAYVQQHQTSSTPDTQSTSASPARQTSPW